MNIADFYKKVDVSVAVAKIVFNYLIEHYPTKSISEIAETSSGGTPTRGNPDYYGGEIPWLKSGELNDSVILNCEEYITDKGLKSSSAKLFPNGTLLVAMYGATAGKVGILNFEASTNQAICAVFPDDRIDRDYVFWYLRQQRFTFLELSRGGAQPNISQTVINKSPIPVPPIEIQKQVVDFLHTLEKERRLDNALILSEEVEQNVKKYFKIRTEASKVEELIQQQQTLLTKLRQSILQEAVQGKLTERWRAERKGFERTGASQVAGLNPAGGSINDNEIAVNQLITSGGTGSGLVRTATGPDETGAELLTRIRAEKAELIRQGKLRKEKPLPPITDAEKPFELPDGWVWCRLDNCSINRDGERQPISLADRERRQKIYDYYGASGVIDKIDGFTHEGTYLLIGEDGANLVSRSTPIAFIASGQFWVNNHAHVIQVVDRPTLDYLCYYINSIDLKPFITGGFQPKLSQAMLNIIPIPIPPLIEQQAIVEQVEKALAQVSELEAENRQQQAEVGRLMQAVLREAFSGKETITEIE